MAFRTRKPFKQADNFLLQFESEQPSDYPKLLNLISAFKMGDVDKMEVFDFIVGVVKKSPDLMIKFNAFLNPDRQVALLSDWRIKKLVEHLMKKTNELFRTDPRFNNFINVFQVISNKMDEQGIVFVSYDEAHKFFSAEMAKEEWTRLVGTDIIAAAEKILEEYITQAKINPPPEEQEPVEAKAVATDKQPLTEKGKRPVEPKTRKLQKSGDWNQAQKGAKTATKTASHSEPKIDPDALLTLPFPSAEDDEKKPENLKIEQNVFRAIRKRMSEYNYLHLIKMLDLFGKNIISYFEFVKLIEQILINVDKKLLVLLREIVEARDQKRMASNVFNLKQFNEEIPHQADNFSYNRAVYRFDVGPPDPFPLINKTFVGIATGNEAATNLEDTPLRKVSKNVSEEIMFKVEDEIHEFDSNIAQIRVSLKLIERLQKEKLTAEATNAICGKLRTVRALGLIYGNKAPKIVEKLSQKPKELMELILERLREKLDLLQNVKRDFVEKGWIPKFADNFYKALDARSNNIKAYERTIIGHRQVLQSLKAAQAEKSGVLISHTLNELMFNRSQIRVHPREVPRQPSAFQNPIICFMFRISPIAKDILHVIGVALKQGKTNFDKKKCWFFLRKAFLNFLKIEDSDTRLTLVYDDSKQLQAHLAEMERMIFPKKDFFYHQKIKVEFENDNSRNLGEELLREFSFGELFKKETPTHTDAPLQPPNPLTSLPLTPIETVDPTNPEPTDQHRSEVPTHMMDDGHVKDLSKQFFADGHMFMAFKYFYLLYERLEFVWEFSRTHCGDERVYRVFYSLLVYHLLGEIDYTNFENAVVTLFDRQSGVLLNFDRIIQHFFKAIPNDDLYNYICRLNPSVFGDTQTKEIEAVIFAKTCQKVCEVHIKENKGQKNQYTVFNAQDSSVEVLKFEYVSENNSLLVHSFESAFRTRGKEIISSQRAFVELSGELLTKSTFADTNFSQFSDKIIVNNQTYSLDHTKKRLVPVVAGSEDTIATVKRTLDDANRHKRIVKLKKAVSFWQERSTNKKA
jgi:hypothetical protein